MDKAGHECGLGLSTDVYKRQLKKQGEVERRVGGAAKKFDNSIPIVELKKKKESLMASYRPLQKKELESEGTGSSTDDIFKPSWYAFEAIDRFMRAKGEKSPTVNSEVSISYLIQLLFTSANQL